MTPEQAAALRQAFPPESIGKLPRAGITLDFAGHAVVTDRLLTVDPEWTWEPFAKNEHGAPYIAVRGNVATMWIRLTIAGVTRPGVGSVDSSTFDVEKQLISDAIRNAAMRFGVALDLWSKEELPGIEAATASGNAPGEQTPAGPDNTRSTGPVNVQDVSDEGVAVAAAKHVEAADRAADRASQGTGKSGSRGNRTTPPAAGPPSAQPELIPPHLQTKPEPFMVGENTLAGLQARVSNLIVDKAPVADSRMARGLPPLRQPLTQEQAVLWEELITELEMNVTAAKIVPEPLVVESEVF